MNSSLLATRTFTNAEQEVVPYSGEPIEWRVSAYAVVVQDDKIFLTKNTLEQHYDVLGGGVNLGETIEEAIQREAREEGGVEVRIGRPIHIATEFFRHRNGTFYQTVQLFFEAELLGAPESSTDENMEWSGFAPLDQLSSIYPVRPTVQKVIATLKKNTQVL